MKEKKKELNFVFPEFVFSLLLFVHQTRRECGVCRD